MQEVSSPSMMRQRGVVSWFDVRGRRVGAWAFALNRITGLGLVLYLIIHLAVLSLLAQGEAAWNDFVALAKTPFFLFLDIVLIFGILFHGLNGIRVALVGMGIGVQRQRTLFWGLMVVGGVLLVVSAVGIFAL